MTPTRTEIKAMVALLEQDWESPEQLAKALITALDRERRDRKTYYAVMQFGRAPKCFYSALGPYAGRKSAENAVVKHGSISGMEFAWAIVPMTTPEGWEARLAEADLPPKKGK